jgi:hypothetical protein
VLNQKSLHKFKKWHKFSSHVKAKLHKEKWLKTRPACILEVRQRTGKMIMKYSHMCIKHCVASADDAVTLNY